MTVVQELRPPAVESGVMPCDEYFDRLQTVDCDTQLAALDGFVVSGIRNKHNLDEQGMLSFAGRLADFAADESSSPSLLVRIQALERALELGYA